MKYAILNVLLGTILMAYAMSGAGGWLAWLGMCFVVVGIAYGLGRSSVYGRSDRIFNRGLRELKLWTTLAEGPSKLRALPG
ncbi:hypothetical protein EI77_03171 [Prosthecobacter fusiformis]|uniref:Uncharacterized protein n=1 Tax=Prosthecobacter fusiformis TaxID=48464 RepID=A0A4R7RR62_9BACT|nr:hypothetical protein [Prosthecobacter fusiformis]TDU68054.1 hypothetical protein EI77_03171 [Prosthecobacter fusiformis]